MSKKEYEEGGDGSDCCDVKNKKGCQDDGFYGHMAVSLPKKKAIKTKRVVLR